jgi:hypothetical protein
MSLPYNLNKQANTLDVLGANIVKQAYTLNRRANTLNGLAI